MGFHDASIMQRRKSGYLRFGFLYGVPTLAVLFFLLHSRLIVLLEQDLQRQEQHPPYGSQDYVRLKNVNANSNLGICHKLWSGKEHHVSTSSVWLNSEQRLLSAIMGMKHHEKGSSSPPITIPAWLTELWKFLTPWNLQQTIFPQVNPNVLQRILNKLQARLLYLQEGHHATKSDRTIREPPKIQVLIFGGSVAEGVGCDAPPPSYLLRMDGDDERKEDKPPKVSLQECSWPHRLQQLANAVFPNAIQIHNLAVGGTHSRAAVPILEHGLYPPHIHVNENKKQHDAAFFSKQNPPDIVLNAYAANDNLPPAFYNTQNTTQDNFHKYRVLKRLMEFVEAASSAGGGYCNDDESHPPWIVFLNDYMGNQQESLVGESTVDELVQLLMQTVSAVSYVSPSRLLVPYIWANTSERVWSAVWKKQRKKKPEADDFKVDVHYGMAGHITTALVVAHAFFQWTMEYCQEQVLFGDDDDEDCYSSYWPRSSSSSSSSSWKETRMQAHELSSALQIDLPSKEWMKANQPDRVYPNITEGGHVPPKNPEESSTTIVSDCGRQQNCAFAFLAAPLGTHSKKGPLQEYINDFIIPQTDVGWQVQNNFRHGGFQNKLGLMATGGHGAQLELRIPILATTRIMKLTMHYLKSYGPDWANSRLRGTIRVVRQAPKGSSPRSDRSQGTLLDPEVQQTFELEGFHDQQVSISYTHAMPIAIPSLDLHRDAGENINIDLKLELIGGSNFKINAMMLC